MIEAWLAMRTNNPEWASLVPEFEKLHAARLLPTMRRLSRFYLLTEFCHGYHFSQLWFVPPKLRTFTRHALRADWDRQKIATSLRIKPHTVERNRQWLRDVLQRMPYLYVSARNIEVIDAFMRLKSPPARGENARPLPPICSTNGPRGNGIAEAKMFTRNAQPKGVSDGKFRL
jgi:hypothetical protein